MTTYDALAQSPEVEVSAERVSVLGRAVHYFADRLSGPSEPVGRYTEPMDVYTDWRLPLAD